MITSIILLAIALYAVWAILKIRKKHKSGSCCGGSCSSCPEKEYCSK